jgi:putative ABC transport system permease protein
MALRNALGAGRGRLVRQLLTESLLLSLAGGALGILVAWGGMKGLATIMLPPPGGVRMLEVGLNPRVLAVTALVSIATGLLFGLAPALMSHRPERSRALKELPTGTGLRHRFRNVLVAAQIAVTVVLLVGSGLLMKSFLNVLARDLHFDPQQMLTFDIHMPLGDYLQRRGSLRGLPYFEVTPPPSLKLARVFEELRDAPGVESVAGASFPLVNAIVVPTATISLDASENVPTGAPSPHLAIEVGGSATHLLNRSSVTAAYFLVTPGFFTSVRARLVQGRDFADRDDAAAPWVAIVNESAASRYWPGQTAVGQRFRMPNVPEERPREVIGVIRDIPLTRQGDVTPVVYASYLQQPGHYPQPGANMFGQMMFMVRTTADPMALVPTVRRIVGAVDPDRPLTNLSTMERRLRAAVPQRGYFAFVVGAFAMAATVLAAIGIYGVVAYSVTQRTREIGIRVALGARAREVILLVGRHAVLLIALGMSAGLAASLAFTQLLRSQLWSVTPTDPTTFAVVSVLLAVVALAAAYVPLRRAAGVNPIIALRE